jgi:targeting protein for Xklp2
MAEPNEPTSVQPFQLRTERRGVQHQAHLQEKVHHQEEQERHMRVPKAKGLPISTDMPFIPPKPQPKTLTMPEPFGLKSEVTKN